MSCWCRYTERNGKRGRAIGEMDKLDGSTVKAMLDLLAEAFESKPDQTWTGPEVAKIMRTTWGTLDMRAGVTA